MKQALPVDFFACSWENAQNEVHQQRPCDWWIHDWPGTDAYWLFGNNYWWVQPQPDHSPLARHYYEKLTGELNNALSQSVGSCESRRYPSQDTPKPGLRLSISSRLDQGGIRRSDNPGGVKNSGLATQISVPFVSESASPPPPPPPSPPQPCPGVRRELFSNPVDFDYVIHGPEGGNIRWEWRDQQTVTPDPYFELYARTMKFTGSSGTQFLGSLHLVIDQLADLWVRFEGRPIPAAVADRVDPNQPLSYQITPGGGYFNIAAVIEVLHLESGQIYSASIHGGGQDPGYLPGYGGWPPGWETMSMDANGVIRHHNVDQVYWMNTLDPANTGLPMTGTYRMRYILLAYGYQTYNRSVSSNALGSDGDTRMSWKAIGLSHMPSLISYTPGMTDGLIPPFEVTYTRSPVLADGIEFDAVFDLKNNTAFRFVVKVTNNHDFALGVIVLASEWQAWVSLQPGETKYLAGASMISATFEWRADMLHPESPYSGWNVSWSSRYVSTYNGLLSAAFSLFLTAPTQPESVPANMPARKATQLWPFGPGLVGAQSEPIYGAIKRYVSDGRYDYTTFYDPLKSVAPWVTKPACQALLDPETYFVTGYDTPEYNGSSPWHKNPWPMGSDASDTTVPIMCSSEQWTWGGSQYVWAPVDAVSISLTRAMLQQVAAALGITEYAVIDSDDIRWFHLSATGGWRYSLWTDRFYTRAGALIDAAAMRAAFQNVITSNAASWPNYRNLTVHPHVRFGTFLGASGSCMLGQNGDMEEVSGLADLGSVSTLFLYRIYTSYQ